MLLLLTGALALSANRKLTGDDDHDHELAHGHGNSLCGCEKDEADHPFTIDCSDMQTIRAATLTLESDTCDERRRGGASAIRGDGGSTTRRAPRTAAAAAA